MIFFLKNEVEGKKKLKQARKEDLSLFANFLTDRQGQYWPESERACLGVRLHRLNGRTFIPSPPAAIVLSIPVLRFEPSASFLPPPSCSHHTPFEPFSRIIGASCSS